MPKKGILSKMRFSAFLAFFKISQLAQPYSYFIIFSYFTFFIFYNLQMNYADPMYKSEIENADAAW